MNAEEKEILLDKLMNDMNFDFINESCCDWLLENEEDWGTSKAKGSRNKLFYIKYEEFENRLLARVLYIEQGYYQKEKYLICEEVQRLLAGLDEFVSRGIYYGAFGAVKYDKWNSEHKWETKRLGTCDIERVNDYYARVPTNIYFDQYEAKDVLLKSIHKYSGAIDGIVKSNTEIFSKIARFEKYPQVEFFNKLGIYEMIDDYRFVNKNKKGFDSIGIKKNELKYLQNGIRLSDYRRIRNDVLKFKLTEDEAKLYISCKDDLKFLDCNIKKTMKFLVENNFRSYQVRDYIDYISNLKQLGYPMQNKYLYPVEFKKAHDELLDKFTVLKNAVLSQKIQLYSMELQKYTYIKDGFLITPARSQIELINESKVLGHCVKSYAEKVANRYTSIFFIRKFENAIDPFVTLELKDKEVIQCRAYLNGEPDKEVKQFVNNWCKKFNFKSCFK